VFWENNACLNEQFWLQSKEDQQQANLCPSFIGWCYWQYIFCWSMGFPLWLCFQYKNSRDNPRVHLSQAAILADLCDINCDHSWCFNCITQMKESWRCSNHVINAFIPLKQFLAPLFTVCFHHRHVSDAFRMHMLSYSLSSIMQVKLRLSLLATFGIPFQ